MVTLPILMNMMVVLRNSGDDGDFQDTSDGCGCSGGGGSLV